MILFLIFWAVCGALCYGWCFAYFQREFTLIAQQHYKMDMSAALAAAMFGPIGIVVLLAVLGPPRHGLKFW